MLAVSLNYSLDDFLVTRMLLSGIPLDESYLHYSLSDILNKEKKNLLGGRLPLPESYYLMGTVDPTGTLQSDEVCIVLYVRLFHTFYFILFFSVMKWLTSLK